MWWTLSRLIQSEPYAALPSYHHCILFFSGIDVKYCTEWIRWVSAHCRRCRLNANLRLIKTRNALESRSTWLSVPVFQSQFLRIEILTRWTCRIVRWVRMHGQSGESRFILSFVLPHVVHSIESQVKCYDNIHRTLQTFVQHRRHWKQFIASVTMWKTNEMCEICREDLARSHSRWTCGTMNRRQFLDESRFRLSSAPVRLPQNATETFWSNILRSMFRIKSIKIYSHVRQQQTQVKRIRIANCAAQRGIELLHGVTVTRTICTCAVWAHIHNE